MDLISKLNARRMALANKKRKGFTMVEMVIVIVIIAVLMAALIPTFATVVQNAQTSAATQAMKSSYEAIKAYDLHDNGYLDGAANGIIVYKANDTTKGYIALVTDGEMSDVYIMEKLSKEATTESYAFPDGDATSTLTIVTTPTDDTNPVIYVSENGYTNVAFGAKLVNGAEDDMTDSKGSVLGGTLVDITDNVCFYNVGEGAVLVSDGGDPVTLETANTLLDGYFTKG